MTKAKALQWTEKDLARLNQLVAERANWDDIGRELGRSRSSCNARYHYDRSAAQRKASRQPGFANAKEKRAAAAAAREAWQSLEHASLTAAFCGDPLPGRSALDKMRAAAIDPRRQPSLYTGAAR
jgi:hypothetical protein